MTKAFVTGALSANSTKVQLLRKSKHKKKKNRECEKTLIRRNEDGGCDTYGNRRDRRSSSPGEEAKATEKQSVSKFVRSRSRFRDRGNNDLLISSEKDASLQKFNSIIRIISLFRFGRIK